MIRIEGEGEERGVQGYRRRPASTVGFLEIGDARLTHPSIQHTRPRRLCPRIGQATPHPTPQPKPKPSPTTHPSTARRRTRISTDTHIGNSKLNSTHPIHPPTPTIHTHRTQRMRRQGSSTLGGRAAALTTMLLLVIIAAPTTLAFSFLPPSWSSGKPSTCRPTTTALASAPPGGGGQYMAAGYDNEEPDPYLQSLPPAQGARGPPPPQRSKEESRKMNEAAKARMEAYLRGEVPPGFGQPAPPPTDTSAAATPPPAPGSRNPNEMMEFYREHEAKLAAENAAKAAAQAALPPEPYRPPGAPIVAPVPEPYTPPPKYQQAPLSPQQQQEAQAKGSPKNYEANGGSRFNSVFDAAATVGQSNPAKERLKEFLLSKYAPDDMSPQAVNYRRLIQFADTGGYSGPSTEDADEYIEKLKLDAREKIKNNPWQTVQKQELGGGAPPSSFPAPPGAPGLAGKGINAAEGYQNTLSSNQPPPGAAGVPPPPPPPMPTAAIPPPPPAMAAAAAYPPPPPPAQAYYQQPPPVTAYGTPGYGAAPIPVPVVPVPVPAAAYVPPTPQPLTPVAVSKMGIESSLTQLGAYLTAHKATGERLQGQDLDRLETLLRSVTGMLQGEGRPLSLDGGATASAAVPPPPPAAGYILPEDDRQILLTTARAMESLASLGADEAGARAAGEQVPPLLALIRKAFRVVDGGEEEGQQQQQQQQAAASPPPPQAPPVQQQQQQAAVAPAAVATPPPPPSSSSSSSFSASAAAALSPVELSSEERSKLQGAMALSLKHSGAFGKDTGPLRGEELGLLKEVLGDTMTLLRGETEEAYGQRIEAYLQEHPEALQEFAQAQAASANEASAYAPNVPPPSSKPKTYKEMLEEARLKKLQGK